MKWENFTAPRVSAFRCAPDKKQAIFWDGKTPGLGVRVTPAGAKSYIFETRLHGKTIRLTIGDARTWTVSAAQGEATRLKGLTDQGIDPRQQDAEKRERLAALKAESARKTLTLGDVWPIYLAARSSKWSEGHYVDHIGMAAPGGEQKRRGNGLTRPGPLAALMQVRMCDLTGERLAAWLATESETRPTAAASSFRMLRALVRWAEDVPEYRGLVPADVYRSRTVRDSVPRPQTKEGDSLQREQLAAWFDAVRKIGNPVASAYLQALLLTGARREEMAALRWADVDFQWRSLTIRDKVEGTRIIPLTPYLSNLLAGLPRRNEWVFSTPAASEAKRNVARRARRGSGLENENGGRITEPRYAHEKALTLAGLPHISIHGLRRSFGTLCEWVEVPSGISAQIMGHKPSALAEKHYRRRPLDLLRKWHDQIEAWILEQAGVSYIPAKAGLQVVQA